MDASVASDVIANDGGGARGGGVAADGDIWNLQKISNTFTRILSTIFGKNGFGFNAQFN